MIHPLWRQCSISYTNYTTSQLQHYAQCRRCEWRCQVRPCLCWTEDWIENWTENLCEFCVLKSPESIWNRKAEAAPALKLLDKNRRSMSVPKYRCSTSPAQILWSKVFGWTDHFVRPSCLAVTFIWFFLGVSLQRDSAYIVLFYFFWLSMFASCRTARRGFEVHVYNLNEAFARAQVDPSCGSIISRTWNHAVLLLKTVDPTCISLHFIYYALRKSLDKQTVQKAAMQKQLAILGALGHRMSFGIEACSNSKCLWNSWRANSGSSR